MRSSMLACVMMRTPAHSFQPPSQTQLTRVSVVLFLAGNRSGRSGTSRTRFVLVLRLAKPLYCIIIHVGQVTHLVETLVCTLAMVTGIAGFESRVGHLLILFPQGAVRKFPIFFSSEHYTPSPSPIRTHTFGHLIDIFLECHAFNMDV